MKTIIKIVLALVVLTGTVNAGMALLKEYQFEDAVHEGLLFDPRMTDAEIVDLVMKAAADHGIPIDASGVTIQQIGADVHVEMSYTDTVNLIPGVFQTDWTFTPKASTRMLVGNRRKPS